MNMPLKSALSAIAVLAFAAPAIAQVQPPQPRTPAGTHGWIAGTSAFSAAVSSSDPSDVRKK